MKTPPPWPDEKQRLEVLWQYEVLDTSPEESFDSLTSLAAQICAVPIALISLVDEKRQWFKSKTGLTASETARDISFCGHAIHQSGLFIVPDAARDERFAGNHRNAPREEFPGEANWWNDSRWLGAKLPATSAGSTNHRALQP